MTKFCKDCAFYVEHSQGCEMQHDMVTGLPVSARDMRKHDAPCGPNAACFRRRENTSAIVERAPITVRQSGKTVARQVGDAIETDMATIRREDDPEAIRRIKEGKPPFEDYQ